MERVFWMLLDKDGALVKNMMDEFHKSHRHSLPENHRKLVLILPRFLFFFFSFYIQHARPQHHPPCQHFSLPVSSLVVKGFVIWNRVRRRHPGDHEEMLGGKPIFALSTYSCGCMASLSLSSQPGDQQVLYIYSSNASYF